MRFLLEYKAFYQEGDIVVIEYWYNDMLVPVKIIEKVSKSRFKVSYDVEGSDIRNAPDEVIKSSDILYLTQINSHRGSLKRP
jgi:hypothetical protein